MNTAFTKVAALVFGLHVMVFSAKKLNEIILFLFHFLQHREVSETVRNHNSESLIPVDPFYLLFCMNELGQIV